MKKIKVPEGMLEAAVDAARKWCDRVPPAEDVDLKTLTISLEAALLWLTEHPILPTDEQAKEIIVNLETQQRKMQVMRDRIDWCKASAIEWQRHMYDAPDPEVPEEVKDLLFGDGSFPRNKGGIDACIIEAYRRGQKSKASI